MDRRTLLKEIGVGLLFGSLLTGSFFGLDFKVFLLGFLGLFLTILGVAFAKEEEDVQ